MAETMGVLIQAQVGSETINQRADVTADSSIRTGPSVAAAKPGVLTTRTDADTGTFTMESGHGFSTSDKIDLFWSGGQRRNMTATVTGNSVVLDGGTGTDLPAATTAITAMLPHEEAFPLAGDNLAGLAAYASVPAFIAFVDDEDALLGSAITISGTTGGGYVWAPVTGAANPLTGEIAAKVLLSHGSPSEQVIRVVALFD